MYIYTYRCILVKTMRSKKATATLAEKITQLSEELSSLSKRSDLIAEEIKKAGVRTIKSPGRGWPRGRMKVSNL